MQYVFNCYTDMQLFIHIIIWPIFWGHSLIHFFLYGFILSLMAVLFLSELLCPQHIRGILLVDQFNVSVILNFQLFMLAPHAYTWLVPPGFSFVVIRLALVSKFSVVATALHHTCTHFFLYSLWCTFTPNIVYY